MDGRVLIEEAAKYHNYCKAEFGVRSMRTMDAWHALGRAYVKAGTRIDALTWYIPDEWERFQSYLIQGPDGHVFWNGPQTDFSKNSTHTSSPRQKPLYYWWQRLYGSHPFRLVACDTKGCVSPYHARKEDRREGRERLFPDHVILGAIQVWAIKHGRSPAAKEWEQQKMLPSGSTIHKRFGTFDNAVSAAGLQPRKRANRPIGSKDTIIEHLHLVAKELGRWPDHDSYRLAAIGRYATPTTIRVYFGTFGAAREAARARYPELV